MDSATINQDSAGRGPAFSDKVRIPGGTFGMGSDRHYPDEAPAHTVTVRSFWVDRTPVTNHQFREFSAAAAYSLPAARQTDTGMSHISFAAF